MFEGSSLAALTANLVLRGQTGPSSAGEARGETRGGGFQLSHRRRHRKDLYLLFSTPSPVLFHLPEPRVDESHSAASVLTAAAEEDVPPPDSFDSFHYGFTRRKIRLWTDHCRRRQIVSYLQFFLLCGNFLRETQ